MSVIFETILFIIYYIAEDILEENDSEENAPGVHGMGGGGYGRHQGQASTSDVFILDRVARKMAHETEDTVNTSVGKFHMGNPGKGGAHYGKSKQLNLDKPRITKALSIDDGQLRLTKPLDVSLIDLTYNELNNQNYQFHNIPYN